MQTRLMLGLGAFAALIAAPRVSSAGPCSSLMDPIVVAGSSAAKPLIKAMAAVLAAQAQPVTLVYVSQGSCVGVNDVVNDVHPDQACVSGACVTGTAIYWDSTGVTNPSAADLSCDLDTAGTHVDVGLSDVWADTCLGSVPAGGANGVKDSTGPVEAMLYVVTKASLQKAITAEEAFFVFSYGAQGQAKPWITEANYAVRSFGSGTQQILAHNIGVPAGRVKGKDQSGPGVAAAMLTLSPAESAIGMLAAADYDQHRDTLTSLAFQAFGQFGAVYADSTNTSFDKRNVRDGHYVNWGYLHMITRLDATSSLNPRAKRFVDWVTGNTSSTPAPILPGGATPWDIDTLTAKARLIPTCAMKVQRTQEGGALTPSTPATDCSAKFETTATN